MVYSVQNDKISKIELEEAELGEHSRYWGVFLQEDGEKAKSKFGIQADVIQKYKGKRASRFESHDGFDYICLNVLNYKDVSVPLCQASIYVKKNLILFICDNTDFVQKIIDDILEDKSRTVNFERLLYTFFDKITVGDAMFLEEIEQAIIELEDALITSKKNDCVKEIIGLRKKLMALKRNYEQFLTVLDAIQENENNIIDNKSMRYFKIIASRVDRSYHSVMNLRDYVTQVREAYQAQVDINLNSIMKLFTVVTSVFLPLTLLVGWYGMNIKMPEYGWNLGYPFVIALSVIIVIIEFIYFKKKKWF
jgi:Mg2+ and Co2+ transporters